MRPQDSLYRSNDGSVSMHEDDGELKIVMRGDAFFVPGSNKFESKTRKYLAEVADVLKTNTHAIHIVGHVDERDIAKVGRKDAFELSATRAAKVAEYLVSQRSIDPVRIVVSGRGDSAPEVPDSMGKVRGNNRRVEIIVINTDMEAN
jgi:chemotaxis protein MotB